MTVDTKDPRTRRSRTAGRRDGRREGRRDSRRDQPLEQLAWGQPRLRQPFVEILSQDEIAAIHQTSLKILQEIGLVFADQEARKIFQKAGALVDSDGRVRLGRDIVDQALKTAPSSFTLTPRDPAKTVTIGADAVTFTTVLGPPNCSDLEGGRRPGTLADFANFVRLGQHFNIIHMIAGSPVEPNDIPVDIRHLESTRTILSLSDKVPYLFAQGRQRLWDGMELVARSLGYDSRAGLCEMPRLYSIINTNSPLQYDDPMAAGVIELARHNQASIISPFSLAGATMPVPLAGAVAMSNAEALAGVCLAQLVRPGAPVVTAAKTVNVDMKTGAPAFATPESNKAVQIGAQLARYLGLPFRAANFNNANAVDAQALYESQGALWAAITSGTNLVMHAAGWMEGGLCASFEKFILDVEILQMMKVWLEPVPVTAESLSIEEIRTVGPGGHFFGTERTLASFEAAFYHPLITQTQNYEAWEEAGAQDATRRAHGLYKKALAEFQPPALDEGHHAAMTRYAEKRIAEGGSPIT
ncbi:trimethylamine methyltransferase family protein [Rhodovibrionaceae bacterium A322]